MIASTDFSASLYSDGTKPSRADRTTVARQEALHDVELVSRFNAGDESAFVEIMTRYRDRMFAVALSTLRNHADAEEIAQDTFVRAHRALANFRGDSSLSTWLHRIALNLSRNRYWYFFRRRRHTTLSLDSTINDSSQTTFSEMVATDAPGPVREAAATEFAELVAHCMSRLAPGPREILLMRNSRNRSYAEIARDLGINIGTVKSRIARAREMLRVLLTEACPEFGDASQPADWFEANRPSGAGACA